MTTTAWHTPAAHHRLYGQTRTATASTDPLTATRAEALFTSDLPTGTCPTRGEVNAAVRRAVHAHGGTRGCATALAGEYGEHPETAIPRMRWALAVIHAHYAKFTVMREPRGIHWSAHPTNGSGPRGADGCLGPDRASASKATSSERSETATPRNGLHLAS
jgi:hypothetical protein